MAARRRPRWSAVGEGSAHGRSMASIAAAVGGRANVEVAGGLRDEARRRGRPRRRGLARGRRDRGPCAIPPSLADSWPSTDRTGSRPPSTSATGRPSGMAGSEARRDRCHRCRRAVRTPVSGHSKSLRSKGTASSRDRTSPSTSESSPSTVARSSPRAASPPSRTSEAVRDVGCAGAIIGRALYEGALDLVAALAIASRLERHPVASVSGASCPPAASSSLRWASMTFSAMCAGHVVVVIERRGERAATLGQ